jgi:sorting nexin-1/2
MDGSFACYFAQTPDGPDPLFASPQFFDQRRQQLEVYETQLRSLVDKLASANKARSGLQASIAELQSAFIALSQCDLSSSLRKLYDQAATVQQKLHDLASSQTDHDERVGSLLSVAESYARMCASAKVSVTTLERLFGGSGSLAEFFFVLQDVFGARVKAYHTWQAAESHVRKLHAAHEKAKRSGRTHSELMNLSVAEIADVSSEIFARMAGEGRRSRSTCVRAE